LYWQHRVFNCRVFTARVLDKYTFPVALLNVETGTFGQVNYGNMVASAVIAWSPA
jgi:hypothetical protein